MLEKLISGLRIHLFSFAAAAFLWSCDVRAAVGGDRLELSTGEVLIGEVVKTENGVITFRSKSLGEVQVPVAGTTIVPAAPVDAAPAAQAPAWAAATPAPAKPGAEPPPAAAPSEAAKTVVKEEPKPAAVVAAKPAPTKAAPAVKPAIAAKWSRKVQVGYSYQERGTEVTTESIYVRLDVERKKGDNTASAYGRYIFGEQNDQKNADKLEAGVKLRHSFAGRLALRDDFSYSFDNLKDLHNQWENSAGFTYAFVKSSKLLIVAGPGVTVQYAEPALGENGWKVLGDVSAELDWKLAGSLRITNQSGYLFKPADWTDYRLRSQTALTTALTKSIDLSLRHEFEFESLRPVENGRADNRVFTTLGYKF